MKKILVVDDSPVDRLLVGKLLESYEEWQVRFASDGHEAIESVRNEVPDIIVTDLQMPYVDGLELVQHVKQTNPSVPIVLITGYGSEKTAMEALRSGAANYTPKSCLQKDLARTVKKVLELSDRVQSLDSSDAVNEDGCQLAFVLENDLGLIGPLIEHLQNKMPKWSEPDRLQIGMALDEALVNAMHHGNLEVESELRECTDHDEDLYYEKVRERQSQAPFSDRRVQVKASFSSDSIDVQITDEGPGFDPELIDDPRSAENVTRVSGRGLFLIRTFMDAVNHNDVGNEITMRKERKS